MNIYQPFTYLITFLPTGQRYYGVRTKQGCYPGELWNSYYTSSKVVRQLVKEHGKDAFSVEIRRVFNTKDEAILWEHRVLRRLDAARNPNWLNQNNGDRKFINHGITMNGKKHTDDARRRMSINSSGTKNPNYGKKFSEETRRKLSEAKTGLKLNLTSEQRQARRERFATNNPMHKKKYAWWNNGETSALSDVCPGPEWVRGRLWSAGHREKMLEKRHPKRKGEP